MNKRETREQRNATIMKDREAGMTYDAIGKKHNLSDGRVQQIVAAAAGSKGSLYSRLPASAKPTSRVKRTGRMIVTKREIAQKFNVPTAKLEIRV